MSIRDLFTATLDKAQLERAIAEYVLRTLGSKATAVDGAELAARVELPVQLTTVNVTVSTKRARKPAKVAA
jgi:hypothetical protein